VRRLGAASLDLCYVAAGRLDAYYERGLNAWDLAAGGLVAAEAGAVVGGMGGRPAGPDLVLAAPPGLFEQLHDLLAPLQPDRD
jgi:myo-inositol-1(or 4)-monophosphatase